MTATHQDVYRSLLGYLAQQLAPVDVMAVGTGEATAGRSRWWDADLATFEPVREQRNADTWGRGRLRLRGYWRAGPGQQAVPGQDAPDIDHHLTLSQAAQDALRGVNVTITDWGSGDGTTVLGAALFDEVPFTVLEPVDGVGTVLADVDFLFSV